MSYKESDDGSKHFCTSTKVIVDNASDVSIIHPIFLTNIIKSEEDQGFAGMQSLMSKITYIGHLDGFFDCAWTPRAQANVLSQEQVKQVYNITYLQGDKYIVHMPQKDLVFYHNGLTYMANMSD